jgi:hypothetical protein
MIYVMIRSLKFAAVVLVLVIVSSPLLAAVTCFGGESPAAMHCPPGCPMMAAQDTAPALQLAAHHTDGSCCDVSKAKSSPVAALRAPVTLTFTFATTQLTPASAPATACAHSLQNHPVRFFESAQSLLCTFLI